MGQCFLKDCGFEFQKLPQNKGKPFPEFFKERMQEKNLQKKKKVSSSKKKLSESHEFHSAELIEKKGEHFYGSTSNKAFQVYNDLIIEKDLNSNSLDRSQISEINVSSKNDHNAMGKPMRNLSEIMGNDASPYIKNKKNESKFKKMNPKQGKKEKKIPSIKSFAPLLDSLRNSVEKSPFQTKISINEKYEKSSLFKIAQNNFQQTKEEFIDVESESQNYDNIFSDGDSSVGNPKHSGFLTPKTNIVNVISKKKE